MITKEFTFDLEQDELLFSTWLANNRDVECLKLAGVVSEDVIKKEYDIEHSAIKEIDITHCDVFIDDWDSERERSVKSLIFDYDSVQPPLFILLFCNKEYATRFIVDGGEVYSIDRKLLVKIPDCDNIVVKDGIEHIGVAAFMGYNLKNIQLPNSLQWIDDYAFSSCDEIENIYLPDSVNRLGEWSFSYYRH